MRRLLSLAVVGVLLDIGSGVFVGPAQAAGGCYVTVSSATIRSGPAADSAALGVAYRGAWCAEKDWARGWTKLTVTSGRAKGKTGWVRDDLVHTEAEDVRTCIPEDVACHDD
ncbi:hypothetical protein ACGFMM_34535 [Streptomyces sp. NPDC048604]|uniref:hypothetical protein n=1 Tax=Streptomyces sp. NPDC048604 TaxID=3365578 RepID=UPI003722099D